MFCSKLLLSVQYIAIPSVCVARKGYNSGIAIYRVKRGLSLRSKHIFYLKLHKYYRLYIPHIVIFMKVRFSALY